MQPQVYVQAPLPVQTPQFAWDGAHELEVADAAPPPPPPPPAAPSPPTEVPSPPPTTPSSPPAPSNFPGSSDPKAVIFFKKLLGNPTLGKAKPREAKRLSTINTPVLNKVTGLTAPDVLLHHPIGVPSPARNPAVAPTAGVFSGGTAATPAGSSSPVLNKGKGKAPTPEPVLLQHPADPSLARKRPAEVVAPAARGSSSGDTASSASASGVSKTAGHGTHCVPYIITQHVTHCQTTAGGPTPSTSVTPWLHVRTIRLCPT